MLVNLLTGLPVILLCLVVQALFIALGMRLYLRFRPYTLGPNSVLPDILLLSAVMLLLMFGNSLQIALWAWLFVLLGEFDSVATALYFSAVTFATLGYGDLVLSESWRLLSGLEAANGILMFGVSTAVMTAAVGDIFKNNLRHLQRKQP
ncbi:MAG: transporter [Pseudomonadales bacterium RIFCSPLOWO2_12_59_9]|nr:potassium channel family protein [Pseudomonas sp.]OHC29618.1 MAG: transporter [Pseudomonadales bacterium RIFCSPLOWO2_12_59_9]